MLQSNKSIGCLCRLCHCWLALTTWIFPTACSWNGPSSPVHSIVVVGGTHGNEYTGVWVIKELDANPKSLQAYPSLQVSTLLGNPAAYLENKRFIDTDLNREFSLDKLTTVDTEGMPRTVESLRAREINALLGPKLSDSPPTDLVVDLHSTTSNMGITLIIPEGDALMAQAAAYVMHKCRQKDDTPKVLMHPIPNRQHRPNVGSTARHGFTIEVGPVPQGLLRHDAVEKTNTAMHALLEFLQRTHDGHDVLSELQDAHPNNAVTCYRSAKAKRPGEMSGKIPWPTAHDNPNFPLVMIHKSLQDRDFHLIKTGDALFVTLEGKIINYEGSHGDEVYLIFVNEGGYYYKSSGTGIGVAVKTEYDLIEGTFTNVDYCDGTRDGEECVFE